MRGIVNWKKMNKIRRRHEHDRKWWHLSESLKNRRHHCCEEMKYYRNKIEWWLWIFPHIRNATAHDSRMYGINWHLIRPQSSPSGSADKKFFEISAKARWIFYYFTCLRCFSVTSNLIHFYLCLFRWLALYPSATGNNISDSATKK